MMEDFDNKHVLNLMQVCVIPSELCVVPENKFLVFLHSYSCCLVLLYKKFILQSTIRIFLTIEFLQHETNGGFL